MGLIDVIPGCPYLAGSDLEDTSRLTIYLSYRRIPAGKFGGSGIGAKIRGAKLYLNCPDNWYTGGIPGLGDDWLAVVASLERIIRQMQPASLQTVGSSMGGYGALALGGLLGADRAVALAPEVRLGVRGSRSVEDVPAIDHAQVYAEFCRRLPCIGEALIYTGDLEPIDCLSTSLAISAGMRGVQVLPGAPHEVAEVLQRRGDLTEILDGSVDSRAQNVPAALSPRLAAWNQAAFNHFRTRRFAEARAIWSRLMDQDRRPSSVPFFLARTLFEMGDVLGAQHAIDAAIEQAPLSVPSLTWAGRIFGDASRHDRALHCLARATSLHGKDSKAYELMSASYAALGQYIAAEDALIRATAIDSGYQAKLDALRAQRGIKSQHDTNRKEAIEMKRDMQAEQQAIDLEYVLASHTSPPSVAVLASELGWPVEELVRVAADHPWTSVEGDLTNPDQALVRLHEDAR